MIVSEGAERVAAGAAAAPDAAAKFSARVLESEYRTNTLTGERFIHVSVDGAFPFDIVMPDNGAELPERNSVLAGTAVLAGQVAMAAGCGGGGGCGGNGGSCGCGGH